MYEIFYNFSAEPFRLSPDHRFCFEHKSYGKARAYMAYAFKRAEGFVMITGRPGTGKTTLIGELVESLSREKVVTANLVCTQLQADDLLKTVAYSFGISPSEVGKAELLQRLNILLHRWHREGRRALLVVDEAQDLSSSAMEELRLLTNIQFGGQPLLQIFLLGQPELRDLILSAEMEQVHQRIVAASHIEGLEADETEAYVIHRLTVVGWRGDPAIDRAIFPLIHQFSEGVPRRINLICSRLFLLGSVEERHTIELADVRVVIGELQAENLAAGTGMSKHDFRSTAAPDWVPVPDDPSQVSPVPPLQAVDNGSYVVAEQTAPLKKKDIPSLEPLGRQTPGSVVENSNPPAARFELLPEEGSADQPLSSDEEAAPEGISGAIHNALAREVTAPDASAPGPDPGAVGDGPVTERAADVTAETASESTAAAVPDAGQAATMGAAGNVMASTSAMIKSPAPRRRLIILSFLMLLAVALLFVLKACFSAGEDRPLLESGQRRAPPERIQQLDDAAVEKAALINAISPVSGPVKSVSVNRVESAAELPRANRTSRQPDELAPTVADADLRRKTPVGELPVDSPDMPLPGADQSVLKEGSTVSFSSKDNPEIAPVEKLETRSWQETILISFSFDSDDLVPDAHLALQRAAAILRENSARVASITGFTDSRGDSRYNLALSRKRADAVERFLVNAGVDRQRLQVEGRGVLTSPIEGQISGINHPLEPFRIVQIILSGEG